MNKTDLIKQVAEATETTQAETATIINAAIDAITAALAENDKVQLLGFGTFETKQRAARAGRNPATGASIQVEASRNAAFKPGKALKAELNKK